MTQVSLCQGFLLELIWNYIIFMWLPSWLRRSYPTLICQRRLVVVVFLWWFCRSASMNFHTYSIAKTASKKIRALFNSTKFLSPKVALYLYKFTLPTCMEYCYHVWDGASSSYLNLVDKLLKRECRAVCSALTTSLEPLDHRRNMVSLCLFYSYFFGRCSSELDELFPFPILRRGLLVILIDCMICHHS